MNFLGHAYLARNNPELIAGNFAGDGYKGNLDKFHELPAHILNGVRLHRKIDQLTDTNENVRSAGRIFQENGVSRVAFIATDILVDYYLSSHWEEFHGSEYEEFLSFIYESTDAQLEYLDAGFVWMYDKLKRYRWMHQYNTIEGIEQIMQQFSGRIGFENDLLLAAEIYKAKKEEINPYFYQFLKDIDVEISLFIKDNLE
ncbi:MAG: ACP phosphodiesterase [Crocinitomicaceae bacterium]|nr:ACP phosphodiesterase [Crocinitomicaceae bacterium]